MDAQAYQILATLADSEIDAMVELMLLVAFADGSLDASECSVLKRSLLTADEFWLRQVDLDERIERAKQRIGAENRGARLEKLRTMLPLPKQRLLGFKLAIQIAEADGVFQPSERELVLQAADVLGIREEVVRELLGTK